MISSAHRCLLQAGSPFCSDYEPTNNKIGHNPKLFQLLIYGRLCPQLWDSVIAIRLLFMNSDLLALQMLAQAQRLTTTQQILRQGSSLTFSSQTTMVNALRELCRR